MQQFSQQQNSNSYPASFMTSQQAFNGPHPAMRSVGIDFSPPTPYSPSPAIFINPTGNFPAFENDDHFDPRGLFSHHLHGDTPSPDENPPHGGDGFHDDDMQLFPDSIPSSLVMMTSPSVKREPSIVTSSLYFFPTTSSALRECHEEDDDELFATFVTSQSSSQDEESPQLTVEKLDRYLTQLDGQEVSDRQDTVKFSRNVQFPLLNQLLCLTIRHLQESSEPLKVFTSLMRQPERAFLTFCKLADQSLYDLVKRAKKLKRFSKLQIHQQMHLLRGSWLDSLIFDHLQRQICTISKQGYIFLPNGELFPRDFEMLPPMFRQVMGTLSRTAALESELRLMKIDSVECGAMASLILFQAEIKKEKKKTTNEEIKKELQTYVVTKYGSKSQRMGKMMLHISDVMEIRRQLTVFLFNREKMGAFPAVDDTLLVEMLRASVQSGAVAMTTALTSSSSPTQATYVIMGQKDIKVEK